MPARLFTALAVALVGVLLWRSVFAVDEGDVALITRFGQIQPGTYGSGAHLKSPLDEVHKFDRRLMTRSFIGESFMSQDQKPLAVDFYLRWRVLDAARFFQATGGEEEIAAARLADLVRDQLRSSLAAAALSANIAHGIAGAPRLEALRPQAAALGVELADVELQRIDLPEETTNAVYQRMQQNLISQAQQLRAQGSAQADKIRAEAERTRAQTLADATREAQRIRGEADAAAAAAYAKAYGANPEFAAFTRTLQAYKNALGREGDILVISPEGEFFKYLHSASGR